MDILGAVTFLFLFSWLYLLIILVYLVLRQHPIFFLQTRIGKGGKPFLLIKFRTLSADTTLPVEKRRFKWGNFLRATSLDELPQVWNILKGNMSWIGPRPLPDFYLSLYSAEQNKRHLVLPGLTGLAQVKGRNRLPWAKKFEYDLFYVHNVSFLLDFRILWYTLVLLCSFKKDVSLSEEKFTGNA